MKLLSLHCDYLNFKALKKALKSVDELGEKPSESNIKEPLVVLTAIEKHDKDHKSLVENILSIAERINPAHIVLYPYAHLSSNLAKPEHAVKILKDAELELKKHPKYKGKVTRAPFGFYKEFELKCKGHPLSELSRSTLPELQQSEDKQTTDKSTEEEYNPKQLLNQISKTKLKREKLKDNDHRILGQEMDLFSFNETAPGMVFWHDKGLIIFDELLKYWKEKHRENNYEIIKTPQIMDSKLWKISGHWRLYKENMFTTKYEDREFAVKPMNCPGGMLVYKNSPKSYKDLPLRAGELGIVHRMELSGVLAGLFRVIQFTQDDAHVFCTKEQLEDEIIAIIKLIQEMFDKFNLKYRFTLSTRSEKKKDKYLGDDKIWNIAEGAIKKALKKLKIEFDETPGEAKFYGPSLDVQIKDSLKREWQCSTIQLDMQLPERFELEYTDQKGKKQRPIMLHRVIYGAIERFLGILLEHTNGRLPTWLAPTQVKLLSFTDKNIKAVQALAEELREKGIRTEVDTEAAPMGGRIRNAAMMKIPFIVTIGDKEEKAGTLAVRDQTGKVESIKKEEFIEKIKKLINERI